MPASHPAEGHDWMLAAALGFPPAPSGVGLQPLDIRSLGALVEGYRSLEHALFEVLGRWVQTEDVDEVRVFFDMRSRQHAWHAELWEQLAASTGFPEPSEARPPLPATAEASRSADLPDGGSSSSALVEVLLSPGGGGPGDPERPGGLPGEGDPGGGTLLRLAALGRVVLPRLVTGYGRHLRHSSVASDAATARALGLVLADETEEWHSAEAMVEALARRPHDLTVMAAHQQRVESLLVSAGPGALGWPR